jgi:capsular exopolysaccharide synthesis family protein
MTNPQIRDVESGPQGTIDWKRIGFQGLRYWYLILLSLGLALGFAWYKNRYSQRIYPVVASIIIREAEDVNGAEILYKNAIIDQYRNYLNEPYILRSYPLIQKVVEELNFDISFYQKGFIRTSEAYGNLPFKARIVRNGKPVSQDAVTFRLVDAESYTLQPDGQNSTAEKFKIGQKVTYRGNEFIIEQNPGAVVNESLIDVPYVMSIRDPMRVASEYIGKLDISWAEEGAGVINLRLSGSTPRKDIDFINGLIANYQQNDLEKKNETANSTVTFISGQLRDISDSLKLFEDQLQRFKKDNKTSGNLDIQAQQVLGRIEDLGVVRAELLTKDKYFDYLKEYITGNKNLEQIILPSSFGVVDPVIASLVSKIVDLQLELKLILDREKTGNPLINSKLARLQELRNELLESIESLKSADKIKLNALNQRIADAEREVSYLPLAERQLVAIKRNYSLLENLYVFLTQKMFEAEISKASSTSDIVVVNPPMQMGGLISPKISQNYTISFIFGLGVPLIVLILIEVFNTKVQSKEDIDKITTIPFIGGVGHKKAANNVEVLQSPKSAIAESFRALRSNLNYFVDATSRPVFLISSSISGERKTFTSLNLASIFALSGKRTLILGADMRKPKIFQDFHLNNTKGLSTFLSGMDSFDQVIQKTHNEFLDLVSAGPSPPNPSELLLSPRMEQFVTEARKQYEVVIIDTPPMAIVTDAFVLSAFADHTLFIVRQNYTPKSLIKTVNEFYESGKLRKMSVVLNDIYKSGPGYGYGYGYGYDYYSYGYGGRKNGYGYYTEK